MENSTILEMIAIFALMLRFVLGSKDLGSYIFRILMCIVGKPWSKQDVYSCLDLLKVGSFM